MQRSLQISRSPKQMMQDTMERIETKVLNELSTQRHIIKKGSDWFILFHNEKGSDYIPLSDDLSIGLLTLAEAIVANPDIEIDIDTFWKGVSADSHYSPLLERMSSDPFLKVALMAQIESIFKVSPTEAVFSGIRSEIYDQADEAVRDIDVDDVVQEQPRKHPFVKVVGGLLCGAILPIACSTMKDSSDVPKLSPLVTPVTTTAPETTAIEVPVPETTVIAVLETTTAVSVLESTTVPVETTPPTIPTTVAPETTPETVVATTAAPTTTLEVTKNDSNLTGSACTAAGGTDQQFGSGLRTVWGRLIDYGFTDQQIGWLQNQTTLFEDFKIAHVMGEGYTECMPSLSVVQSYLSGYSG